MSEQIYQCPECGLHYRDETTASLCEAFCREHQACDLEIIQYSLERQEAQS
jgi:hypothetical protein